MFDLFKSHKPKPAKGQAEEAGEKPGKLEAAAKSEHPEAKTKDASAAKQSEIGGPEGPEPTRYGDWERKGICYDF